ncbi:putative bifunctional diguanylate cyclase/phosphodiesterase [Lutibaculum baratangense]|uniref:Diguanylate cyclase/phosphodiesterase (GGDEF & EAL domains) with PAS/PAC sensor(S) n=1 Tax=Lutibaculum baratangense AMV1 TaxID=631454 RepID=V4RER0_9HYPH|nr:EAL domain-containing protein [Lutibaculum baratangense]ESR23864.1 diguanylate cyclase/phosphodiesterase (GGDEF & EAL domains) with PAS/PAC sensor(s) [Lutibaculum baratangense AMV1]
MPLVIILDDQVTNQHIFAKIAASISEDIRVQTFGDPEVALAWIADGHTPDLVITDYKMPGMNGAAFIKRLRMLPELEDVPVVVITVFEERSFRLRALDAGATDFLQSPVDHQEFVTRARNLLKLRKQQLMLADRAVSLEKRLAHSERSLEEAVRDSSERLGQVIDAVPALICATDREHRFIFMNAYQGEVMGVEPVEMTGRTAEELFGEEHGTRNRALDRLIFESGRAVSAFEEEIVDRSGRRRVFLTTKSPLKDSHDRIVGVVTSALDITERKASERHLHYIAHHDALTGLPNRAMLRERLRREVVRARRGDRRVALHLIDLDSFKSVNDVLGHSAGDKFLVAVARRLRPIEQEGHMVTRLGGDEFAILEINATEESSVALAERIAGLVTEPTLIAGQRISSTTSIGIAVHPADGADVEELLRNADLAMYAAKRAGGNQHRFYAAELDVPQLGNAVLDAELRDALEREEFLLHYQPQVSMRTGEMVGVEALIRWRKQDGTMVPPYGFLPRAEENGLIVPISDWVLREACRQSMLWRREGLPPLRVGINLSPVQFRSQTLPAVVARAVSESGIEAGLLDLELTESIMMQDADAVAGQLHQLRELGVQISIDDFGTGFSSLSYVKRFPVDRLKIDQSFIRDIKTDPSDCAIVRAIIHLGQTLNLQVIAEGVETKEQFEHLRSEGCDEAQGYYFGKPMPPEEISQLLREKGLKLAAGM